MSFDIESTIEDMISAVSGVVSGEWPEVKDCVKQALEDEKEALEEIAKARINGEIDDEDMKSQLEDEKVALEVALLACQVKAKAVAQKAVNAAVDVFRDAVSAVI